MVADFFSDKVAVITGGVRNIGKAVAHALVERGTRVVIGDILSVEGQETVREFNERAGKKVAAFQYTDVTKYKDMMALFDLAEAEFGGVDIAFLNAGIPVSQDILLDPFDDANDEKLIKVNILGVIKGTKVAAMHLAKRGGGVIVNTASTLGIEPLDYSGVYNASKAAVINWSRSFSSLPDVCNVRINAVCPHAIDTVFLETFPSLHKDLGALERNQIADIKTVVRAALLLMEDQDRNGQVLQALPDDVITVQKKQNLYDGLIEKSEKAVAGAPQVKARAQEEFKQKFDRAMKRYFSKL
ncbi:hypothetical protein BJV82DRAFT_387155 [Fennellomyces sp. T-0311]|nr:hypothetical protein BJV82DRAFT_387155 [Fennellomyces sp. T-0311]